jgi:hypothetical protein
MPRAMQLGTAPLVCEPEHTTLALHRAKAQFHYGVQRERVRVRVRLVAANHVEVAAGLIDAEINGKAIHALEPSHTFSLLCDATIVGVAVEWPMLGDTIVYFPQPSHVHAGDHVTLQWSKPDYKIVEIR